MEREEDEECTKEEEEIGDMLLGLTLFGNRDATFGCVDAPEFTGCSGWGPDFPEDNKNVGVEKENEEEVTLEAEEVARILLMLS